MNDQKNNDKADLVRFLSQRGRSLLLLTIYKTLSDHEAQLWLNFKKRYRELNPRNALAHQLGIAPTTLHNYLNLKRSIPDRIAIKLLDLIDESQQPFFFLQDIASIFMFLAKAFPRYRSPHEFKVCWHLPSSHDQMMHAVEPRGAIKFCAQFLSAEEGLVGLGPTTEYLVFSSRSVDLKMRGSTTSGDNKEQQNPRVSILKHPRFSREKYLIVAQKSLDDGVSATWTQ
jgi:hypothetical protein